MPLTRPLSNATAVTEPVDPDESAGGETPRVAVYKSAPNWGAGGRILGHFTTTPSILKLVPFAIGVGVLGAGVSLGGVVGHVLPGASPGAWAVVGLAGALGCHSITVYGHHLCVRLI